MITYEHYQSFPVKVRFTWIQKILQKQGYNVIVNGQKDKPTTKALKDLQVKNGLSGNSNIDLETFTLLLNNGGKQISLRG
jgi:hypothetical protein